MIIKKRDSKQAEIDELTTLLSVPPSENKKFLIEGNYDLPVATNGEKQWCPLS
jgi:hypothetical protein